MSRAERVAVQIQRELGELLREVKDPRVQAATLVTVTHVRVSDDLGFARVLVSILADEPRAALRGIANARGFLQGQLGKRLRMKKFPELRFDLDETEDKAGRVEEILRELQHEKEE